MKNIIEVKNLTFEYEENLRTIDNISFSIKEGTYTTILGHNGSGKSTIAKLLMGLLEKKTGDKVNKGDLLCTLFTNNPDSLSDAETRILAATEIKAEPTKEIPQILAIIR